MTDLPKKITLCKVSAIKDPGSLGINVESVGGILEVFLVRKGNTVYGYQNHCPHTGVNLDWMPDQFLDPTESFIQCATHGAIFRIEDGYCLRGPCAGECLQKLDLLIERDEVIFLLGS
ncbi:MAG: Rieske 2Fe-2S domain-containing protein [Pseudomonadota bacterium]